VDGDGRLVTYGGLPLDPEIRIPPDRRAEVRPDGTVAAFGPDGAEAVVGRLQKLLAESLDPGAAGSVRLLEVRQKTYTGLEVNFPDEMPDFETPADNPYARRALKVLGDLFPDRAAPYYWRFATDAGHFGRVGTVALGFAPGDDTLPHTYEERVGLRELVEGLAGYIGLALGLGRQDG